MPTMQRQQQQQEQAERLETAAEAGHRMGCDKRYLLRRAAQAYDGGRSGLVKSLVVTAGQDGRGKLRAWRWQAPPGVWDRIRALPIPRGRERPETLARGAGSLRTVEQYQPVAWSPKSDAKREAGRGLVIHCGHCRRGNVLYERGEDEWRCMACGRGWEPRTVVQVQEARVG